MINILAIAPPRRRCSYRLKAVNSIEPRQYYTDRELAAPWKRFCALCRELAAAGFDYQVTISLDGSLVLIDVTGSAGRAPACKPKAYRRCHLPAKKTADYCCGRKMAAQKALRTGTMSDELMAEVEYWTELESLAETRDKWKPGLGPEVDKADMEVTTA